MTQAIDPLLDIQTKVLRATFVNNMAVLKKYMPDVYKFYENYSPSRVKLTFDQHGHVNLVSAGNLVYQGDPKAESEQQVKEFLEKPRNLTYKAKRSEVETYEHQRVLNLIGDQRFAQVGMSFNEIYLIKDQIDFIAFMGTGLGYHLQSLFNSNAIKFAFVYEPDPDCFYCTLHSVDIGSMITKCFANGGKLTLQIGGNANGFVNEISKIFKREGYYNIAKMFLFRHYLSDETNEAFQMVHDLAYRYSAGWGFCEDEVIGISHTLTNIATNNAPCVLKTALDKKEVAPVFIIGNGPSLDYSLEYLRENQDNAIIISSGTSLKPLLDNGVIPDIHVEQERPASIYKWVKKVGHEEKLKNMNLICLNTVYPEILGLFKKAHVILKPSDAGGTFIKDLVSEDYAEVYYCNPTVTNASSAAAVAMGFENLYLFGVDYGFKSEDDHHSKDSIYFKELDKFKMKGDLKVPGNFGGEVHTTTTFDTSKMVLELLLQANPSVKCINTSDGAKVGLSIPCQVKDLAPLAAIKNKSEYIETKLANSFSNKNYTNKDLEKEFESLLPSFNKYIKQLQKMTKKVANRSELAEAFNQQFKFVNNPENNRSKKLFYRFFNGTLNYFQTTAMSNVYQYKVEEEQNAYIQFCIKELNAHLDWLVKDLAENYNKAAKA